MSKVKIGILIVLVTALGITAYKWWNSDQGGEYVKQQKYDDRIQSEYGEVKKEEKSIKFKSLLKRNSDVIGWIDIKGTPINYPIMMTENNDYYLNRNLDKQYSSAGSIFADKKYNELPANPFEFTDNRAVILYGHNMGTWTDVMFTSLKSYLSENYYKKHKTITIYYPKETGNRIDCIKQKYEIIAVTIQKHYSSVYEDVEYMKNNIDEKGMVIDSEKEKNMFESAKSTSRYNCGDYNYIEDSNYMLLSTCANDGYDDDRIIIICRLKK